MKSWDERAEESIAQGCLTYSKRSDQFVKGVYPTHISGAEGCTLYDTEGKKYIDFIGGLGSNIISSNNNFCLPHFHEVVLAEKIKEKIGFIDKLRLLKTGSDACSAAIRIARAYKHSRRTNEDLLKMFKKENEIGFSQRSIEERWSEDDLQKMCKRISIDIKSDGNKEIGATQVFQDSERDYFRKKALTEKMGEGKTIKEGLCLWCSKKASCSEAMRKMWKSKFSGTPQRLQQASGCDMAVPVPSCPRTQGFGLGTGYHGFHNWTIATEYPGAGCIDEKYIKLDSIEEVIKCIESNMFLIDYVIVEPVQLDLNVKYKLMALRKACDKHKAVLIFDEVITGFRTPKYCIAQYLGVTPDLICLGKAMANGFPISVIGGKKEIMDAPYYFVSSTFAGELASINAAIETIDFLTENKLLILWEEGRKFQDEFNKLTPKLKMVGIPTKAVFRGDELFKNLFWQEMCKSGFILGKAWHIMWAHLVKSGASQALPIDDLLMTAKYVIKDIESGNVKLEGQMAQEVFKRY
jgi:glutamate-1-semialdehyde aminotransferase